jgi:hypothetical protein
MQYKNKNPVARTTEFPTYKQSVIFTRKQTPKHIIHKLSSAFFAMGTATPFIKTRILRVVHFAYFDSKMSYKLTVKLTHDTTKILYTQK